MTSSSRRRSSDTASAAARETRSVILAAARDLFAEKGFDATSMRAVAARAGVDAALIYYHFEGKDDLLVQALAAPPAAEVARRPIPAGTVQPGKALVRAVLEMWEYDGELRQQASAMFRAAASHPLAAERLQAQHTEYVSVLIAQIVADDNESLRAGLIGAQLHGLLLSRYLLAVPQVAEPPLEVLVNAVGPVIDRYLTGDLGAADRGD